MLSSKLRAEWTVHGRTDNENQFTDFWNGERDCPKLGKDKKLKLTTPTTDSDRIETASFAWAAYAWMSARMIGAWGEDKGIWKELCKPQSITQGIPCANTSKMNDIVPKLASAKCH